MLPGRVAIRLERGEAPARSVDARTQRIRIGELGGAIKDTVGLGVLVPLDMDIGGSKMRGGAFRAQSGALNGIDPDPVVVRRPQRFPQVMRAPDGIHRLGALPRDPSVGPHSVRDQQPPIGDIAEQRVMEAIGLIYPTEVQQVSQPSERPRSRAGKRSATVAKTVPMKAPPPIPPIIRQAATQK